MFLDKNDGPSTFIPIKVILLLGWISSIFIKMGFLIWIFGYGITRAESSANSRPCQGRGIAPTGLLLTILFENVILTIPIAILSFVAANVLRELITKKWS